MALSRVRSLAGLHIADLASTKICVHDSVIREINRLRLLRCSTDQQHLATIDAAKQKLQVGLQCLLMLLLRALSHEGVLVGLSVSLKPNNCNNNLRGRRTLSGGAMLSPINDQLSSAGAAAMSGGDMTVVDIALFC